MTQPTRIYKHSGAGTDWAALILGAGLGLTLALQLTTVRKSDFTSVYATLASVSRLSALVGTYFAIAGIFLVARIPWVEKGVGHDRLVTWHRKLGPWSLYGIGAHVFFIIFAFSLVLAAEAINTAIEFIVDLVSPDYHPLAGQAKDVAAAAVLFTALGAAIVGMIIFVPKLWSFIQN